MQLGVVWPHLVAIRQAGERALVIAVIERRLRLTLMVMSPKLAAEEVTADTQYRDDGGSNDPAPAWQRRPALLHRRLRRRLVLQCPTPRAIAGVAATPLPAPRPRSGPSNDRSAVRPTSVPCRMASAPSVALIPRCRGRRGSVGRLTTDSSPRL